MSDTEDLGYASPTKKAGEADQIADQDDSSRSSHGSADEFFNQQRKQIRQKLGIVKPQPPKPVA